ncbi:MAG: hypothetical protein ABEI99_07250 [Halobaculum sp.]
MSRLSTALTAIRGVVALAGFAVTARTVVWLATYPSPPPGSDGFAYGMAGILGSLVIAASLTVVAVAVAAPTLLGMDDPLGFGRRQQLVLNGVGVVIGLGLLAGVVFGYATIPPFGVVALLPFLGVAILLVGLVLAWRLAELLVRRWRRSAAS